jgi:hypothetical protein
MVVLLLALAACSSKSSDKKVSEQACLERRLKVMQWMTDVATDIGPIDSSHRVRLVTHAGGTPSASGITVELERGRVYLDGKVIGPPGKLLADESNPLFEGIHPASTVYLAIDRSTRWRGIHTTLAALRKRGLRRVAFVFDTRARAAAPGTSSIDARLSGGAPPADVVAQVFRKCKQGHSVIAGAVNRHADRYTQALEIAKELSNALFLCGCAVDSAELRSLLWFLYGSRSGRTLAIASKWIEVHDPGDVSTFPKEGGVAFSGARQWRTVADEVARAPKRVTFGILEKVAPPTRRPEPAKPAPPAPGRR